MINEKIKANLAMALSKVFNGLNTNALKFLIPIYISPLAGVTVRGVFTAVAVWIISIFYKDRNKIKLSKKTILKLFLLGALGLYGDMSFYLGGLKYTTPVSTAIISSLVPLWVFIISIIRFKEKVTLIKCIGLLLGIGGVILNMYSYRGGSKLASDPVLGDFFILMSSIIFAFYLIFSNKIGRAHV